MRKRKSLSWNGRIIFPLFSCLSLVCLSFGCSNSTQSSAPGPTLANSTHSAPVPTPFMGPDPLPPQPIMLDYSYSFSDGGPNYMYSVDYKVDFQAKQLTIGVNAAAGVTTSSLPTAGTKTLTDAQVSQIRSLLGSISGSSCTAGATPAPMPGAGSESLKVSLPTEEIQMIQPCHCTMTGCVQSTAKDIQPLVDYLTSL